MTRVLLPLFLLLGTTPALASESAPAVLAPSFGFMVLALFLGAYLLVFAEERLHLRKSKPVLVAAGLIWIVVVAAYAQAGKKEDAIALLRHNLLEYAELLLFLLAAMGFINAMMDRGVFNSLRARLVGSGLSFRALFWVTGGLAFALSPIADNLTTALAMGTVALVLGRGEARFTTPSCVNIVVAANAGGAFSPFGDITTLMIWQKGVLPFADFFALFFPSLVNWLVPATLMSFFLPRGKPDAFDEKATLKKGGLVIVGLFAVTLAGTVSLHHALHIPPFLGMMLGFGLLHFYGYFLRRSESRLLASSPGTEAMRVQLSASSHAFDSFEGLREIEWDTLLFFYGIILCVGGLGAMGYLATLSQHLYGDIGPLAANIGIGALSAIVDNIPLTFAVLSMEPEMNRAEWLLLTLTAGTGGSLLSIGSAAGVALMGAARGVYTFNAHLRWSWTILLGYAASILTHLGLNGI